MKESKLKKMNISRRKFMKRGLQSTAMVGAIGSAVTGAGLISFSCNKQVSPNNVVVQIPLPIQVVIDDVGWWSGKDGSEYQQPYRTGIARNHVPADYQAIVELGKALGVRPQAATVLGEWDQTNFLRKVPHITWEGDKWDNSKWVGPWLEEAADIINSNKDHYEITMHGVGHEWWTDGKFTRAEWADSNGVMRPEEDVERHLDAFAEIMRQNNLGELPKSFVPTAFHHGFGITGSNKVSMAELLRKRSFTYVNTPFEIMLNKEQVKHGIFGVDSGLMTVDRGADILDWDDVGVEPQGVISGATCGMHWPNLLHENPERSSEIVDRWVKLLAPYDQEPATILARDSVEFQKQLAHHVSTKLELTADSIALDFSVTNGLGTLISNNELTLKINSERELIFSSDNIDIASVSSINRDNSMLYKLNLGITENKGAIIHFKLKG